MKAGIWDKLMDAVRARELIVSGWSTELRSGFIIWRQRWKRIIKIAALEEVGVALRRKSVPLRGKGLRIKIAIAPGQAHYLTVARELLNAIQPGGMLLADKAYDAD